MFCLVAALAFAFAAGCANPAEADAQGQTDARAETDTGAEAGTERSVFAMNTYMTFTAYGEGAETALQKSEDLIQEVESLWSVTEEGSDIYRANHSGGQTVAVSE